jgi:hypothetical protein
MNGTNSKYSTLLQAARLPEASERGGAAIKWVEQQNAPPQTTHLICTLAALGLVLPVDHRERERDEFIY